MFGIPALAVATLIAALSPEQKAQVQRTLDVETARVQTSPNNTEALYKIGLAYLVLGDAKLAIAPLERLTAAEPASADAKLMLARAYRLAGETEKARALLSEALAPGGVGVDDASFHAERGLLARQTDETASSGAGKEGIFLAVSEFEKAVELAPNDAELHFNLGEALQKEGKHLPRAATEYLAALQLRPDLSSATINLARVRAEQKRYAEAKELFRSVLAAGRNDSEAHYNLGVLAMRENDIPSAIGEFEAAVKADINRAAAWNNLGVAYDLVGQHAKALEAFSRATSVDPQFGEAFFNLGLSYYGAGNKQAATKAFEAAMKLQPGESAPYLQLGRLYLQQGKNDRAVEAFKKAIAMNDDSEHSGEKFALVRRKKSQRRNTDAEQGLALAYLALAKPADAVNTMKTAVDRSPKDAGAHAALANAYLAAGNYDAAIASLKKRAEIEPGIPARIDLAKAYARKRVSKPAEALYREVLKVAPDNDEAKLGLADLYLAMGQLGPAESLLSDMVQHHEDNLAALGRYGILHSRMQRPDKALPALEKVADRDPTQLEARAELAFLYFRNDEVDRAMQGLNDVLAVDPKLPVAIYYRGVVLYRRGDSTAAEAAFKKAAEYDSNFPSPWFSLGELYQNAGKPAEAREAYLRASKLGFPEADEALKALKAP